MSWVWCRGQYLPLAELTLPVTDTSLEHGVGLFETLRTWQGQPVFHQYHRNRLITAARDLALPVVINDLPDQVNLRGLREVNRAKGDGAIRITASGGGDRSSSLVWARWSSLPAPIPDRGGWSLCIAPWRIDPQDPLTRYKSLNYWSRKLAWDRAHQHKFDEALLCSSDNAFWEGSRTSLFMAKSGEIFTPSDQGPIVPGVMRAQIIDLAQRLKISVRMCENGIRPDQLADADEIWITNSVRGVIPVQSVTFADAEITSHTSTGATHLPQVWTSPGGAPGEITRLLRVALDDWIAQLLEGKTP